jgi:Ca2+-binding EF-hand superfamily protein
MQVSRAEFMIFVLQELDLVERDQLDRILSLFDSLDVTGDGILNLADMRSQARETLHAEMSGEGGGAGTSNQL